MSERIENLIAAEKVESQKCIVRISTSYWSDNRGLHVKRDIRYMRRMGNGIELLEEDAAAVGADETMGRIQNFMSAPDGLYRVITINEWRDWETGIIEDYDFLLVAIAL